MRPSTRRGMQAWTALGTLVLVAGLAACSGGDDSGMGPNGGDPGDAVITAAVMADGSAEQGVTLALFEENGTSSVATATTDMAGEVEFAMLDAGTYEVEITVPTGLELDAGESARKAVTVGESGQATVSFALTSTGGSNVVVIQATSSLVFDPDSVMIEPGTTVRWVNDSGLFHTVTPDGHTEWSHQDLSNGTTFEHTFDVEGTFPYYCQPHQSQGMTGTIVVQSQSS